MNAIQKNGREKILEELHFCASHMKEDAETLVAVLINQGYTTETAFDKDDAELMRLNKK